MVHYVNIYHYVATQTFAFCSGVLFQFPTSLGLAAGFSLSASLLQLVEGPREKIHNGYADLCFWWNLVCLFDCLVLESHRLHHCPITLDVH